MEGNERTTTTTTTDHELLKEIRDDVKEMGKNMAVLISQNLDVRLNKIETWQDGVSGQISMLKFAVVCLGTITGFLSVILAFIQFFS
jgi:uncharacterized membrane protein (DUF106 family)